MLDRVTDALRAAAAPIPMLLYCPRCGEQHIDGPQPEKDWTNPPHRSHECQTCGFVWRPADVATTGVAAIETKGQRDHPAMLASAEMRKVRRLTAEIDKWNAASDQLRDLSKGATPAVQMILQERSRQITEEGYDAEHDDKHHEGQLAMAAACYAVGHDVSVVDGDVIECWPWEGSAEDAIEGKDRLRQLVIAGALIAAELDRMLRVSNR